MLALLALGLGLRAGPATVSLTEFATPLTRLMPKLADLTHQPLKASKAVEGEVLCIDVHDVDTDELLKRIAQATGCDWLKEDDGLYLVPNEKARNALTQKGFSVRVSQIEKEIEAFNPAGKASPPQNPYFLRYQADVPPILFTLLKGVGAETIAAIAPSERLVFSSRPTARQESLPPLGPNDISDYIEMENNARKRVVAETDQRQGGESPIAGAVAKVDLVLERYDILWGSWRSDFNATLVLYDSAGKELDRYYLPVDDKGFSGAWGRALMSSEAKTTEASEKPIKLSPEAIRFARTARTRTGRGPEASLQSRRTVEEELLHPELHDPLAYPSEFLAGTSEARHLQLVASLPDSFAAWQDLLLTPISASKAVEYLKEDPAIHLESADGWMIVAPTDFSTPRMDRKELADLSKRFRGSGSWSLDDLIDLDRAGLTNPSREIFLNNWLESDNDSFIELEGYQDWKLVRFMSTLDPALRARLTKSQSFRVGDFGLESRKALEDAVYGCSGYTFEYFGPLHVDADFHYPQHDLQAFWDTSSSVSDFRSEPTEVAPNGLPLDAIVTITAPLQEIVLPAAAGSANMDASPTAFGASPLERFASLVAGSEPGVALALSTPRRTMMTKAFSKFYIGTETSMSFRVYAGPESFKTGRILTRTVPLDNTYTSKTLPSDLQTDFDSFLKAAEARLRTNPFNHPVPKSGPP